MFWVEISIVCKYLTISHLGLTLELNPLGAQIIKIKFSTKILQRLFLIPCVLLGVLGRNVYCLQISHLGLTLEQICWVPK